jgi:hypothetical protein
MLLVGGLHDVIEHGVEGTLCTNRTSVEIFKPRAPRPSGETDPDRGVAASA